MPINTLGPLEMASCSQIDSDPDQVRMSIDWTRDYPGILKDMIAAINFGSSSEEIRIEELDKSPKIGDLVVHFDSAQSASLFLRFAESLRS